MITQTIEVEGLPEGWKAVAFRVASHGEFAFDCGRVIEIGGNRTKFPCLIVEKIQPRRIVLDETAEVRKVKRNEYYIDRKGNLAFWSINCESIEKYNIVREVKETDIPLTNEEPYLKLTKKDMFYLIEHIKLGGQLNPKIAAFIKDK